MTLYSHIHTHTNTQNMQEAASAICCEKIYLLQNTAKLTNNYIGNMSLYAAKSELIRAVCLRACALKLILHIYYVTQSINLNANNTTASSLWTFLIFVIILVSSPLFFCSKIKNFYIKLRHNLKYNIHTYSIENKRQLWSK